MKQGHGTFTPHINDGHGNFIEKGDGERLWETPLPPGISMRATYADVDGDGQSEVVVTQQQNSTQVDVYAYDVSEAGDFTKSRFEFTLEPEPDCRFIDEEFQLEFADINADHRADIVAAWKSKFDDGDKERYYHRFRVYVARADGGFELTQRLENVYYYEYGWNFMDINGDGLTDMVMKRGGAGPLQFYLSDGQGFSKTGEVSPVTPDSYLFSVQYAEVNGDGMPDLIITPYEIKDFWFTRYSKAEIHTADMDDPDMGMWSYRYDANGNLIARTAAKNTTVTFGYDKRNRLINKTYPEGAGQPDAVYTYCLEDTAANRADNRVNRLRTVDTGDVTTEYIAYDPVGRVSRVRKSVTGDARCKRKYAETAYEYDLSGKVAVIYYPEDDMDDKDDEENYDVEYLYYPGSGLIKAIVDSEDRTLAAFDDYPASGKIGHITFHNQVQSRYAYSPFSLRLESITTMDRDDQPLMDRSYGYTLAGDIEDINDTVNAVNYSYTYDRLHRLVGENASAPVETTPMVIDFI